MINHSSGQNWIWICLFLVCNTSGKKITVCGFTKDSIPPQSIPYSIVSVLETDFLPNKWQWYTRAHAIHWAYHVPHHFEAIGLTGEWDGPLKTQLWCQLGVNTLQGWSKFSQNTVYTLSKQPPYGASSLISKNQGVKTGLAPLISNFSGPLGRTFSHPLNCVLSWFRDLSCQRKCVFTGDTTRVPSNWKLRL